MRSSLLQLGVVAAFGASLSSTALAQRITGDQGCVQSCFQISTAVTQCSDLSDTGVISCICPNSTNVEQLNACDGCMDGLNGITDFEKNSISTLHDACANGGSTAGLSSAQVAASSLLSQDMSSLSRTSTSATGGTIAGAGATTSARTSAAAAASSAAASAQSTGAAGKQMNAVPAAAAAAGLAAVAGFAALFL